MLCKQWHDSIGAPFIYLYAATQYLLRVGTRYYLLRVYSGGNLSVFTDWAKAPRQLPLSQDLRFHCVVVVVLVLRCIDDQVGAGDKLLSEKHSHFQLGNSHANTQGLFKISSFVETVNYLEMWKNSRRKHFYSSL